MNGVVVSVAYRPKPGKEEELLALVRGRVPTLRKEGLVTRARANHHALTRRHDCRSFGMEITGSNRCRSQEPERFGDVE